MREFTEHLLTAFRGVTGWNDDNSYAYLNATADGLLKFPTPTGLRLNLSSLATPHFASSYDLGSIGVVDGSVSYLYSSAELRHVVTQSERVPLLAYLQSYRQLHPLSISAKPETSPAWQVRDWLLSLVGKAAPDARRQTVETAWPGDTLLYGRLYLPRSSLEAMAIKRLSPSLQMQLNGVSDASLRNGGTVLGMLQYDQGKFGLEGLASTDGGLMGIRGIYNWGGDASPEHEEHESTPAESTNGPLNGKTSNGGQSEREKERIYGRFSAGAEMYYGTLNKSGGISLGLRFATLPGYKGTPLTATLTVNPLMGNIQASYAVVAQEHCAMATQLDFNVYSYESDWSVGMELWGGKWPRVAEEPSQTPPPLAQEGLDHTIQPTSTSKRKERSLQAKLAWRLDDDDLPTLSTDDQSLGVLKARLDQRLNVGLLWEGRIKALLFSLGTNVDMKRLDSPFRSIGLAIQYSS